MKNSNVTIFIHTSTKGEYHRYNLYKLKYALFTSFYIPKNKGPYVLMVQYNFMKLYCL